MKKIFYLFIFSPLLFSQIEFQVNSSSDSTQRWPSIDRDGLGNYYVVWQSSVNLISSISVSAIILQQFNANDEKVGSEIVVNSAAPFLQEKPYIATNQNGKSVVAWVSYENLNSLYDIKARIFNQNIPAGDAFTVNTFTNYTQTNPSCDIKDDGEFVVVWDSWFQDGSDRGVFAQRFDSNGNKIGIEFQVNQTSTNSQAKPKVKYLSDGKFIVIWESFNQDGSGYGMYGKIFNSDASQITNEFQINSYTNDYQWFGDLDVFDDDSFIVVWCSWEQDGDDGGIYVKRFSSQGNAISSETRVNKTTAQYQWLPRVKKLSDKNAAVVWSSWKQDGSREGIVAAFIDENNQTYTFETLVNSYSESFQWEPDFIVTGNEEILVVWSTWEQFGSDYDIAAKRIKLKKPQGIINPSFNQHSSGTSTTKFVVHIVDSTALTGDTYKISFQIPGSFDSVYADIFNQSKSQIMIHNFPINKGVNTYYLTEEFDGAAVEFLPKFKLELDLNTYFINNSGSNLTFNTLIPTLGQKLLAPIDIALVWGSADTLSTGEYVTPLDTALSITGQKNIITPFYAKNMLDDSKITVLVKEAAATKNFKWDPKEEIVFITPPPYQVNPFNTHAQLNSNVETAEVKMPDIGDSILILTNRPITSADTFYFTTNRSFIISDVNNELAIPEKFILFQNYPNPFNPITTIKFIIPANISTRIKLSENNSEFVTLKVFDLLGREIATLINGDLKAGSYSVIMNSEDYKIASGVYFYRLIANQFSQTKKMILLR